MNNLGLYLHIPFCLRKCPYCSFYSLAGRDDLQSRYVQAVGTQLRSFTQAYREQQRPLTSIFFGGGTPTLLSPETLSSLLADCLHQFRCADEIEISIEVNPATVDARGLAALRRAGFNRLSIGVQSLNDAELRMLQRSHTVADAVRTVQMARAAGFDNINLDLMYGLPGQAAHCWRTSLDRALELHPEHLSIYELTIESGTAFARQQEQGLLSLPDEDTVLLMLEKTQQVLDRAGFNRYEISNYARPGCQCRHNINYWQNGEYIGLGAGAVAFLDGTRYTAIADAEQFCEILERIENGREVWTEKEKLDRDAAFRETVITGLRMTAGVSLPELTDRFALNAESSYGETLHRLIRQGMLHIVDDRLQLTAQGFLLADAVMAELV
jgi:oxygen-independent coproporphyrinogen-3 oxidase